MTIAERVEALQRVVALARREIALASLEFMAANDNGKDDADGRAWLLALGAVIAKAEEKLELFYAGQRSAQEEQR